MSKDTCLDVVIEQLFIMRQVGHFPEVYNIYNVISRDFSITVLFYTIFISSELRNCDQFPTGLSCYTNISRLFGGIPGCLEFLTECWFNSLRMARQSHILKFHFIRSLFQCLYNLKPSSRSVPRSRNLWYGQATYNPNICILLNHQSIFFEIERLVFC